MFTYEYFKKYETENNKEILKEFCSRLHSFIVSDYTTDDLQRKLHSSIVSGYTTDELPSNVNYSQDDYEEFIVKLCDHFAPNISDFLKNNKKFKEKFGKIFEEALIKMIKSIYLDKIEELTEILNNS